MKEIIQHPDFPPAKGPYSIAVKAAGFLFISGQIPLDTKTGKLVEGDIEAKTRCVLDNLRLILERSGSSLAKVVKCQVFLRDLADFPRVNSVYAEYFREAPPARVCIQAAKLPLDCDIEIDAIAEG